MRQAKCEQLAEIRRNAERTLRANGNQVRAARIRQLRRDAGTHASARLAQQELEFGSRPGGDGGRA